MLTRVLPEHQINSVQKKHDATDSLFDTEKNTYDEKFQLDYCKNNERAIS